MSISLNGVSLKFSNSVNILGLTFDKTLDFRNHISNVRKKISKSLGILYRAKNFIPMKCRKLLYTSLILPHISYGIELWGDTSNKLLDPLYKLQKKSLRFIENQRYNAHISYAFQKHNLLKLVDIHKEKLALTMFKAFNHLLPMNIQCHYSHPHLTRTRQSAINLNVLRKGTRIHNRRPSVSGPFLWNGLDAEIRQSISMAAFRFKLKRNLLQVYGVA